MPNNLKFCRTEKLQPMKERYQDKNEIKILGKILGDVKQDGIKAKLPLLITKRNDITPLVGVNWLKQLPITINKISLDKETDQSETIHTKYKRLFEINHTIHNTKVKTQIKPGIYPIQQKARPIPYNLQGDVKNKLDRLIKSGHLERLETIEEDCFTVKKEKPVKIALYAGN